MAELSTLARPYAKAAFDYANENQVVTDWQGYMQVASSIAQNQDFQGYMHNPAASNQQKVDAMTKILGSDISIAFSNFLMQLSEHDRLSLLPYISEQFDELYALAADEVHAYVTSAYPLSDSQALLIENQLAKSMNKQVVVHSDVDESLIAGVLIRMGDKVIDDSVRGKLQQLRTQLST